MFSGNVSGWGLPNGIKLICTSSSNPTEYVVGDIYTIVECKTFYQLLTDDIFPNKGATISTCAQFILANTLSEILCLGECNGL